MVWGGGVFAKSFRGSREHYYYARVYSFGLQKFKPSTGNIVNIKNGWRPALSKKLTPTKYNYQPHFKIK